MRSTSIITDTEAGKAGDMCIKLSHIIGQVLHGIINFDKTSPDAAGLCNIDRIAAPFIIMEVKREYGDTGYDLATQSISLLSTQVAINTVLANILLSNLLLAMVKRPINSLSNAVTLQNTTIFDHYEMAAIAAGTSGHEGQHHHPGFILVL